MNKTASPSAPATGITRTARLLLASAFTLSCAAFSQAALAQDKLSDSAQAQIAALIAEKDARTPAQRKIDSQLLYAERMASRRAIAAGVMSLDVDVDVDSNGRTVVDIRAVPSKALLQRIKALGGDVQRSYLFSESIIAELPLDALEELAAEPAVRFIAPKAEALLNTATVESEAARTARLEQFRRTLSNAVATHDKQARVGAATSQGDATHRSADARAAFGLNGTGLRIGIISDSFNNLGAAAANVTAGDLPGPTNPNGFLTPVGLAGSGDLASGGSDEGRAMVQIVHDVAPGAQLYFANAFTDINDFANNIRALRGIATSAPPNGNITPGCDIIIDDIFYYVESGLHDGQPAPSNQNMAVVTQAVNDVTADGALYFSSAGNSGNLAQGTSGAWEGDFTSGTRPAVITGTGDALVWSGTDVGNTITTAGNRITMQWSDPIGASTNDYDLFRLNAALTTVAASSTNVQTGTQDPYEFTTTAANTRLVVVRRAGAAERFISLSTNRGRLHYATNGQIRGHSAASAVGAFSVAATPAAAAFGAPTPTGPFPGPFVGTNQVENFSSDGPRRSFFNANGTPVTPGNFLAATNGGIVRPEPDITAADGVVTTLPAGGLNPFYGTSAAAPHAGAIAALVKQGAAAGSTPAQLRGFMTSTALDIMTAGTDVTSGPGILQAFQALQATGATPRAVVGLTTVAISGDNNRLDPNDCNALTINLRNDGAVPATAISAVLSSSTPGITITTANATYPDLAVGASAPNQTAFNVSTAPSVVNGSTAQFTLVVSFTGGVSPTTLTFSRQVGVDTNAYLLNPTATGATIPAGGTLVAGSADDDAVVTVTTPFAFSVYGTPVTAGQTITLSTNGNIQFTSSGGQNEYANAALPTTEFGNVPVLMPYWDDLVLNNSGGGIYTQTIGSPPNRQFIVEWRGHRYQDGATTNVLNFAVVLNEGSNLFEYRYALTGTGANANGASATVGVQAGNTAASRFTQFSLDQAAITAGMILNAAQPATQNGSGVCSGSVVDPLFGNGFE